MASRRIPVMIVVTAALSLATVADAGAQTYCVNNGAMSPPSCPLGADSTKTFPQALAAAQASTTTADTILLAPGTFTDQSGTDFAFDSGPNAANDLTITGAGTGLTTLTQNPADLTDPIFIYSASTAVADAQITDLTVSLPPGFTASGLFDPTDVHRVNFMAQGPTSGTALRLSNRGTFDHMDIEMPLTGGATALAQPNVSVTVTDSTIVADKITGSLTASDDVFRNLRVHAGSSGFVLNLSDLNPTDATTFDNVQIQLDGAGSAINAIAGFNTARVNATNVTVTGADVAGSQGIVATSSAAGPATVNLSNSVVAHVEHPLVVSHNTNNATINAASSIVFPNAPINSGGTGTGTVNAPAASVGFAEPRLATAADGLLYPRFDSPAIDHGDPSKTNVSTDLAGHPRGNDGDGNGTALPDSGAIEYQHLAPVVTATAVGPFTLGTPTAFGSTAADPDPGDTVSAAWTFSDGGSATGAAPSHTFAAAGPFGATFTATDPTGLTAQAQVSGQIAAPAVPPPPPPKDTTKPVVSGARFDPKTFRASSANTATSAVAKKKNAKRPPAGSKLRLSLSEPASAAITIAAKRSGRLTKSGKKSTCKAKSKANRKGRSCTYYMTKATLKRAHLVNGANAITFTGRINHRALAAGAYRATITPKDAAGNTGKAVTATFAIAR